MLSCFPFSYSPLKDDDYNHLFIGQEDISNEAKDNCLNISLNSVDSTGQPLRADKLRDNTLIERTQSSGVLSHTLSSQSTRDTNLNSPVPLPRTFRKPDALSVDSCNRSDSTPVSNTTTNHSFSSSAKSSLLKLGFHRSKGTEHLQQEAIRKSNEANSASLHCQRYIKLPTSSINRFCDSIHNRKNTDISNSSSNYKTNNSQNKSKSTTRSNPICDTTCVSLPKPPLESVGLNSVRSPAPSSSLLKSSNKNSPELSPKPPPRPQTSHPGLSSGTSIAIMPRQKVQSSSVNTSDTLSSALNDQNSCNLSSNTTRATSLTTSASNTTTCASSVARNSCQSGSGSTKLASASSDWNRSGTFINKPALGWLHPDQQIADPGIFYSVRYVGCLGINTSMKSLDFDTRSQIAKECINRVCESGGLKTPDKKRRPEKRINRMLADTPNMDCAGEDVDLVITSSYLHLTSIETGENIARHEMPNISFASGGDADTLDFVAYVAKDQRYGRACFVLECGGGLAQDVITTIGQAFELRFKEFLKRSPRSSSANDRLTESTVSTLNNATNVTKNLVNNNSNNGRLEDREYYNDLPGKIPPDLPLNESSEKGLKESATFQRLPTAAPRSAIKKTILTSNEQNSTTNLIDLNIDIQEEVSVNSTEPQINPSEENNRLDHQYVNCSVDDSTNNQIKTNDSLLEHSSQTTQSAKDPFDMQPFNSALAAVTPELGIDPSCSQSKSCIDSELLKEDWFHGPISRKQSEELVVKDGDFLVRESQGSSGQYVLTGMQSGIRKHLLLVDPEGVVRTKDKTFESVSHLINYHRNNGLPIISAESALVLRNPVIVRH